MNANIYDEQLRVNDPLSTAESIRSSGTVVVVVDL